MREKLARHRANPACASCHELMEPIGLALEKFDGIGNWRETEAGKPIDVTGQLPDGTQIDGAQQLAFAIAQREDFAACAVEKSLIYALGRGMTKNDKVFIESIAARLADDVLRIRTLLREVVLSRPFRERREGE